MDFFEHQDLARKNSKRFVLLYVLTVVIICTVVGGFSYFTAFVALDWSSPIENGARKESSINPLVIAGIVSAFTGLLIVCGSIYRVMELRGGGSVVARSMGGLLIDPSTKNPDERRVLNVVEEMAIASGVPVPPVYMMGNEKRINAFAAGYAPGDAVIGVTRGCIEGLTRDELQGVMAHEFSHILNGDMRLNIRMLGMLNGIVLISIIGHSLIEAAPYSGRGKNGAGIAIALFIKGAILLLIGSIGALSARMIQAAVSRQREYLADASAVQFTRNPNGIANALRRIGGTAGGAKIRHPRAQEAGHMFFGEGLTDRSMFSASLASHPPLSLRIQRVLPSWDGTMLEPLQGPEAIDQQQNTGNNEQVRERVQGVLDSFGSAHEGASGVEKLLPLLALSGMMLPEHIEHARSMIDQIPVQLRDAAHEAYSGRAVVYALLLDRKDVNIHTAQIKHLKAHSEPGMAALVEKFSSSASTLKPELRLPLLDMTLGALSQLSDRQHTRFRKVVDALIKMDKSIDLFEWVTMNTLKRHLDEQFGMAKPVPVQYYNLKRLGREVSILLSMLVYAGAEDEYAAGEAMLMGESAVPEAGVQLLSQDEANMRALDSALQVLAQCAPRVKKQLLQASALVIGADHEITTMEAELLRAVGDSLGVPTPPLLPGQKLS